MKLYGFDRFASYLNGYLLNELKGVDVLNDFVCYCFEHTAEDIERDYLENGKSTIMEKIQMEKKFGNCKCAAKNPKGR